MLIKCLVLDSGISSKFGKERDDIEDLATDVLLRKQAREVTEKIKYREKRMKIASKEVIPVSKSRTDEDITLPITFQ